MRAWIRYTLCGILAAGFVTGVVFLAIAAGRDRSSLTCSALEVSFADDLRFVNEEDVQKIISSRYGIYEGCLLDSIRLERMEAILDAQSAILKSQVWVTDDGILHVSLTQRKPVIRFMNRDEGFYVDGSGYIFPLFERFTADVPLIEGNCPKDSVWIGNAIRLIRYMEGNWLDRTESIRGDSLGQLTLKFKSMEEEFRFGRPEGFEDKFMKITQYLKTIQPQGHGYTHVDLTLNGQIVCR